MVTKGTMFKKIGTCLLCFALGISAKYGMDYIQALQIRESAKLKKTFYVDKGEFQDSVKWPYGAEYGYLSHERVLHNSNIIPDAETASKVGIAILSSLYGKEVIEIERPFEIELVDDSLWYVRGSHSLVYPVGGHSEIILQRKDGKVLFFDYAK